jgi:hypothetical protein
MGNAMLDGNVDLWEATPKRLNMRMDGKNWSS